MTEPRPFILFHNGGVGDFLMFVFLSQQLHTSNVASHVTIVVPRAGAFLRGLAEEYPYITLSEASRRDPRALMSLVSAAFRPATALLYPTIGRIPLRLKAFAWMLTRRRGSMLAGFDDGSPMCRALYDKLLVYDKSINYAELMRTTAAALGAAPDPSPPRLSLPVVPGLLEGYGLAGKRYVVFHPGAGMSKRRRSFEDEEALGLIRHLLSRNPSMYIVLSGGSGTEGAWVESLAQSVNDPRVQAASGRPAAELGGLIRQSACYIGGDTGVTHLACFVGARVLEVAHNASTHWLCYYCPEAVVLYRLKGEEEARSEEDYVKQKAPGVLRPFDRVPMGPVMARAQELLG